MSEQGVPNVISLRGRTAAEGLRLWKNKQGYSGETISIRPLMSEIETLADSHGWDSETFGEVQSFRLLALRRADREAKFRVYISAGIHGDEPAGPLAVRDLLRENLWPPSVDIWLCPCLNPAGFVLNSRGNSEGADLNRQYLKPEAREVVAHVEWLQRQPGFDLCLCLHEDWESHGFYLYELNPDQRPSFAEAVIQRVQQICPIDRSDIIEGRPATNGIIRPNTDPSSRPQWPEAFFLLTHKTRLSYTMEAPSDFPLATRVAALREATQAALQSFTP